MPTARPRAAGIARPLRAGPGPETGPARFPFPLAGTIDGRQVDRMIERVPVGRAGDP